jgi:hypothetical protein
LEGGVRAVDLEEVVLGRAQLRVQSRYLQ